MRKYVLCAFLLGFRVLLFSGCSMMPDDEEIIRGSVLENEIFGDELLDDGLDDGEILTSDEELLSNDDEGNENLQGEDYELSGIEEENLDGDVVVDVF